MSLTDALPRRDGDLLSRARRIAGATTDDEAIDEALRRMTATPVLTREMLIDDGEYLVIPKSPGFTITGQMIEDALVEDD